MEENFYEMSDARSGQSYSNIPREKQQEPRDAFRNDGICTQKKDKKWFKLLVVSIQTVSMVTCIVLVVIATYIAINFTTFSSENNKTVAPSSENQQAFPTTQPAESGHQPVTCRELDATKDGFYELTDEYTNSKVKSFCDMTTDGGGWTLVASINDDDVTSKCDSNDRWSKFISSYGHKATNWENHVTFGSPSSSTINDYKSTKYFSETNYTDVMIWHVPYGKLLQNAEETSSVGYFTKNGFLKQHGGNLQQLFANHYPLLVDPDAGYLFLGQLNSFLDSLAEKSQMFYNVIPQWYKYTYQNSLDRYYIDDSNLYSSSANRLNYYYSYGSSSVTTTTMYYKRNYTIQSRSFATSRTSYPFHAAIMVDNEATFSKEYVFGFKVIDYLNSHTIPTGYSGTLTLGDFTLEYVAANIQQTLYTTCKLFYIVYNVNKWRSIKPKFENIYNSTSSNYNNLGFTTSGGRHYIQGYMLLARKVYNSYVSKSQAENALKIVLQTAASSKLFEHTTFQPGLTVPVHFSKGSVDDVTAMQPADYSNDFKPGFIHFRFYNRKYGYPLALCPGIQPTGVSPELFCVGPTTSLQETCTDFAGWWDDTSPANSAHSLADLRSSLLIFYR